jgi:hypothetical protein
MAATGMAVLDSQAMAGLADLDEAAILAVLQDDGFVVLPALLSDELLARAVRQVGRLKLLSPGLRRLAGVAAASEYLGFIGGQDPELWLRQSLSQHPG